MSEQDLKAIILCLDKAYMGAAVVNMATSNDLDRGPAWNFIGWNTKEIHEGQHNPMSSVSLRDYDPFLLDHAVTFAVDPDVINIDSLTKSERLYDFQHVVWVKAKINQPGAIVLCDGMERFIWLAEEKLMEQKDEWHAASNKVRSCLRDGPVDLMVLAEAQNTARRFGNLLDMQGSVLAKYYNSSALPKFRGSSEIFKL